MQQPSNSHREHEIGRSFEDPSRPLGAALLERTAAAAGSVEHAQAALALEQLANRAKAISVLRKAEEFLYTHNPSPHEVGGVRRALELGAGRLGITFAEYESIVKHDRELGELERQVIDEARAHA